MENVDKPLITMAITGDVMLGRLVDQAVSLHGVDYPWGSTLPLLTNADLTLVNLECVIAANGRPWDRTPKVFYFHADPLAVDVLKAGGVDYVSLANNHSLDYEEEGLEEMLERLDRAGIAHAGAGRDLKGAMAPAFVERNGVKIGIVSFTDNEPGWEATSKKPGTNFIRIGTGGKYFDRVKRSVEAAHRDGADLVVFSIHWGPNMRQRPSTEFRQFAYAVIDLGVDVFHGTSSHLFQGVEVYQRKPILYDAGDFVDDYAVDPSLRNDQSLLFLFTASPDGVERLEMVPVLIGDCQVNPAKGHDFDQIAERMQMLSSEFGTQVDRLQDRLAVQLQRRPRQTARQVGQDGD
ncbi:MAG: CapA family protein [Chloroflexi bacterium]|nr:CapA family protein [Chloroflexota bacterium]